MSGEHNCKLVGSFGGYRGKYVLSYGRGRSLRGNEGIQDGGRLIRWQGRKNINLRGGTKVKKRWNRAEETRKTIQPRWFTVPWSWGRYKKN